MIRNIYILFLIIILFSGCKKYPPPDQALIDPPELCTGITGFDPRHIEDYILYNKHRFYYANAQFNPTNDNQIFALKYDSADRTGKPYQLICYNAISGFVYPVWQKQAGIHPIILNYSPGPTGSILIQSSTYEIYMIAMSGGPARKIISKPKTGGTRLTHPSWNRDGSRIMVYLDRGPKIPGCTVIFDANANPLDTIYKDLPNSSYSGTSNLLTAWDNNGKVVQYSSEFNKTVRSFQTPFKNNTGMNVALSPNGFEMIVCDYDYIYKVNLIDSTTQAIRTICDTKQYGMPSYSSNGDKILFTKQCFWSNEKDTLLMSNSIHVMDKNCFHQDSIPLPVR